MKLDVEQVLARLKRSPVAKMEVSAAHLKTMRLAWQSATKEERSQIVATLFKAVCCDLARKDLVALEPKPAFARLFSQWRFWNKKGADSRYDATRQDCSYLCPQGSTYLKVPLFCDEIELIR
ncbi:MAG TPA: hypothetical protein DCP08_09125 [Chloroflexi bacterium]|nr:hypothetical protein [Chloroflexota bacterium]